MLFAYMGDVEASWMCMQTKEGFEKGNTKLGDKILNGHLKTKGSGPP